jgi:cytochrome c553
MSGSARRRRHIERDRRAPALAGASFMLLAALTAAMPPCDAIAAELAVTLQCTVCHGSAGNGNPVLSAPAIAGVPAWYLKAQLTAYRSGIRGTHPDDEYGHLMAAVAKGLSDEQVDEVVAWAAALAAGDTLSRMSGDADRGRMLYGACTACHGEDGAGNQALAAPALAGRNDWYLARQLADYRDGLRGSHPDDPWGAAMQAVAATLTGDDDITDVSTYLASLDRPEPSTPQETAHMKRSNSRQALAATALSLGLATGVTMSTPVSAEEIVRYPLPNNSTFPIARAVETPAGTTLIHHSGLTPRPVNPDAERFSPEYWGDTKTQAMSVFSRMEASLEDLGLGFGDIIKMTVFLVGVEDKGGRLDFSGFMEAYTQFFGTEEQPNLPARSAVQVAGLAAPGMLVEVEVILARPAP